MKKIVEQVGEYLAYCEKVRGMSSTTMRMKENVLWRFVRMTGLVDIGVLTNEKLNGWTVSLAESGVAPRSINTYNAMIVAMVRYWQSVGMEIPLQITLVGKMREGAVRRKFYSADEVETAISYAEFEVGLMIRIMFETGMRIAELTRLRVADFSGRRIQFIGKGRKPREVYIREDTLYEVQKYIRENDVRGYLFATLNGEPPTTATVRKKLRRPFVAAGFDDFYPHALRHSFATNLQMKGASVAEIKEMMGHESVATTERYLHGLEGRLEELFDKYG